MCHGPAALVNVTGRDYLPERRATGLSNAEEEMYGYVKVCISFIRLGIISLITSLYAVPLAWVRRTSLSCWRLGLQSRSLVARTLALDPAR